MRLTAVSADFWRITRPVAGSALLSLLLALGGCASSSDSSPEWAGVRNEDAPAKLVNFDETTEFIVRWHRDIGDSSTSLLQPALTGNAIYAVSADGYLSRLDRDTGKKVWRIKTGIAVSAGVGSGEGMVVVGGGKGEVLAFDESGKQLWQGKVSSEALSLSEVVDGMVVVRSGDGRIIGLNAVNGQQAWVFERSTPALVVRSHAGVTIQRGVVLAGLAGGKLVAIRVSNGEVLWETSVSQPRGNTELERISDITSNPVVDD
ncbi:MAG TPA: PQQ-binding-like beta-propeller repeat protein, partial [Gallionella sp.]